MKGTYFLGSGYQKKFEVRDIELRELKENEVLIKNMACGICGTDVHIYHGEAGSATVNPPIVLGHEFSGVIEKVGDKVKAVKIGDHVTIDPNMYCGKCRSCRMGRKQNCESLMALGVNMNGGFAQYSIAPETQCFTVNKDVDFDVAAMAEPLACVIHGIDQTQLHAGQTVVVIGGGAIGLLMVQMAKLSGATTVVLSEPVEMRRKLGRDLGADFTIDPAKEDINEKMLEYTRRAGADVIIECVGKVFAVEQAIKFADYGATVLLFSVPSPNAILNLPLFDLYKKELKIVGSMINPDTHQRAVNLINSGSIRVKELITHVYGLDELDEAIHKQMSNDSIKVVVHPQTN